jgi:hypothetical protein
MGHSGEPRSGVTEGVAGLCAKLWYDEWVAAMQNLPSVIKVRIQGINSGDVSLATIV